MAPVRDLVGPWAKVTPQPDLDQVRSRAFRIIRKAYSNTKNMLTQLAWKVTLLTTFTQSATACVAYWDMSSVCTNKQRGYCNGQLNTAPSPWDSWCSPVFSEEKFLWLNVFCWSATLPVECRGDAGQLMPSANGRPKQYFPWKWTFPTELNSHPMIN